MQMVIEVDKYWKVPIRMYVLEKAIECILKFGTLILQR